MRAVTRAAEGFDRRALTVSEVLRMQEIEIIAADERYELVGGEIVPCPRNAHKHELIKSALIIGIVRALPQTLWFGAATTLYVRDDTLFETDIVVFPRSVSFKNLGPRTASLVIEVTGPNRSYDLEFKPRLYARHKFPALWVVDSETRVTQKLSAPEGQSWREREEIKPDEALTHPLLPSFSLRLSDF